MSCVVRRPGEGRDCCSPGCPAVSLSNFLTFSSALFCPSVALLRYESEGRFRKQIKAQKLWFAVLESQVETGTPYMLYKDACNSKSNQQVCYCLSSHIVICTYIAGSAISVWEFLMSCAVGMFSAVA